MQDLISKYLRLFMDLTKILHQLWQINAKLSSASDIGDLMVLAQLTNAVIGKPGISCGFLNTDHDFRILFGHILTSF